MLSIQMTHQMDRSETVEGRCHRIQPPTMKHQKGELHRTTTCRIQFRFRVGCKNSHYWNLCCLLHEARDFTHKLTDGLRFLHRRDKGRGVRVREAHRSHTTT